MDNAKDILLVEDNSDELELIRYVLEKNRLQDRVQVARNGQETLDCIFGNGPDNQNAMTRPPQLILLDLKLPKVSGIEVLQRIKADPRTHSIPVVVLTSSREPSDVSRCYELLANSYVVKPVDLDRLAKIIQLVSLYWLKLNHPPPQPQGAADS